MSVSDQLRGTPELSARLDAVVTDGIGGVAARTVRRQADGQGPSGGEDVNDT